VDVAVVDSPSVVDVVARGSGYYEGGGRRALSAGNAV